MYCRYCGKKTNSDKTVCAACAKKQHSGSAKVGKQQKRIFLVVAVLLLGMVVLTVSFILVWQSPKEKVENGMNELLSQESKQLNSDSIGTRIAKAIYQNVSFNVISVNRETATIEICSPDIYSVYMSVVQNEHDIIPESKEEYDELVSSLLETIYAEISSGNYKERTAEVIVQLCDEYEIQVSYELVDAIYGGLLSLQEELITEYTGGDK